MFLSQAANKGRKFHRTSEPDIWYWLEGKDMVCKDYVGDRVITRKIEINAEMLISIDWEPEPKKIEITSVDLLEIAKILNENKITHQRRLAPIEFMKLVIEQLGLED